MKTIGRLFTVLVTLLIAVSLQAQSTPGCYSKTISVTGRVLIYSNPAGSAPINLSSSYYTTGSPGGVSITIETGSVLAGTSAPFTQLGAQTNTTSAQFADTVSGALYWYANLGTLSAGTSPTVVYSYCVRAVPVSQSTTVVASTSVTGSGAAVAQTSPTLVTPVLGVATGTSIDLTGGLDTGVAGSTVGTIVMNNATSGAITLSPGTGALGSVTMTAPNMGVASALLASTLTTNTINAANSIWAISNQLVFEGATADAFETFLTVTDPTADSTFTFPSLASGADTVGQVEVTFRDQVAADATDRAFFLATKGYILTACSEVHSVAAGGASKIQVTLDTTTAAPGAGTDLLTNNTNAGFDLNATANTPQVGTLVAVGTRTLVTGDRLSVDYANTIQSSAGIVITCSLIPN